jgi:hypothetical protein
LTAAFKTNVFRSAFQCPCDARPSVAANGSKGKSVDWRANSIGSRNGVSTSILLSLSVLQRALNRSIVDVVVVVVVEMMMTPPTIPEAEPACWRLFCAAGDPTLKDSGICWAQSFDVRECNAAASAAVYAVHYGDGSDYVLVPRLLKCCVDGKSTSEILNTEWNEERSEDIVEFPSSSGRADHHT